MSTKSSLLESLENKYKAIKNQGEFIRDLKSSHASKSEYDEALEVLRGYKLEKQELENQLKAVLSGECNGMSRESFREAVDQSLRKNMFCTRSKKIYDYDYATPGFKIKQNIIALWEQHFVEEEEMQQVKTPSILPEASGHVQKYINFMVRDACYRACQLFRDHCKDKLEKDLAISSEDAAVLKHILDDSAEQLGAKIKEYCMVAPDTKNPLSDPYPLDLMFETTTGMGPGYMCPETAHGIFVGFKDWYSYNHNKLPFAVAQVGPVYKNEISPSQRLCEFTIAEIEHFVDPKDKSHPKFSTISNLEFLMLPRAEQMTSQSAKRLCLDDAVAKGIISHQTLAYFIGRVYLFLTSLGIDKDRLRFRQHLQDEMAHYESDCWGAEIETSYGWYECVGISDRSDFDLRAQSEKSGVALVAQEQYAEPKEVEKLVITPKNKELGPVFKSDHKMVVEALKAMTKEKALEMKAALESNGEIVFEVCKLQKRVTIKKNMVSIEVEKKLEHVRTFTPHVIESGFGIGRILYCLYEHAFYTRFGKKGIRRLNVFRFPPLVAPFKCAVFPLVQNKQLKDVAERITASLKEAGFYQMSITAGTSIEKKYANADELGVPFTVTVDSETSVTIRERDSMDLIHLYVDEVAAVVKKLSKGDTTWADISQKYSADKTILACERDSNVDALAAIVKDISEGRTPKRIKLSCGRQALGC